MASAKHRPAVPRPRRNRHRFTLPPNAGKESTMSDLFPLPAWPSVPLAGESARFPVRRVFCVGRNYEAHAREMGFSAERDAPFYFTKTPSAICASGSTIPYPPGTQNCHYEMELVVAIGAPAFRIPEADALSAVLGYACGFDLTRRDLQYAARDQGKPWDFGKDFENAAVIGPITRAAAFGTVADHRIVLTQNGVVRQDATLTELIWSVPELIAHLSRFYHLQPGDLLYTGTPAGVGPIAPGDVLVGTVDGLAPVELTIGAAE
jgi:fumarylpyruvate hydrolase